MRYPLKISFAVVTRFFLLAIAGFLSVNRASAASGPPGFIQVPADRTVIEGEQLTLTVLVDTASAPFAFQWFENDQAVAGATSSTFVLPPVIPSDDGSVFSVTASNALGTITSSNALLTVRPGIVVSASANGAVRVALPRGWPLILDVGLLHPEMFDPDALPILICSTNGPWSNALEIHVVDALGQIQSWPLNTIPTTNEILVLTDDSAGRLGWWLAPDDTAQLSTGRYELTVTLNTTHIADPLAWRGIMKSVPVMITVTNEPVILTEADTEEKHRLFARYAPLGGDQQQARQQIDALLSAYPTNIGGLTMSMYLQRNAGQWVEALQTTEQALAQVYAQSLPDDEPPAELLKSLAELQILLAPPTLAFTLAAGQLTLQWDGRPDTQYKLESSGNLTAWEVRSTNFTVTNNRYGWTTNVTSSQQFFRVTF